MFSVFGMPAYIHSDRGSSFISTELKQHLTQLGIATSRTTPYITCNGQVERYDSIVWRTVQLALQQEASYTFLGRNGSRVAPCHSISLVHRY